VALVGEAATLRDLGEAPVGALHHLARAPRRHPGEEIIYVLEGTLEYGVEGQPKVVLKPGDVLFVPAGVFHSARNVGDTPGSELATYVLEKGKPLTELVP